jgi:hypothetical protein
MVDYTWSPVPGILGYREVQVTVTALPGAVTGVLAESQSDWIVPRPHSERIPPTVRQIVITSRKPGHRPTSTRVTDRRKVSQVVAVFNAMPIVQPIIFSCPLLLTGSPVVTFTFRTRPSGRTTAHASFTEFPHLGAGSGPCNPVELRIHGRPQDPLTGGHFVSRLEKILGVDLSR